MAETEKNWKISIGWLGKKPDGYPDWLLNTLANRGIKTKEELEAFLSPEYEGLLSPFIFSRMEEAVQRIVQAKANKEKVVVYGDYDVDGICATAILAELLNKIGIQNVDTYIPHREEEGYGLHEEAILEIISSKANLIISVDCGISSKELIEKFSDQIDFLVCDHHEIDVKKLPKKGIILHPALVKKGNEKQNFCAAGLAFYFSLAVQKEFLDVLPKGQEKWFLDLAAMATICDVIPLAGQNRILAKWGILVLSRTKRVGLVELARVAQISLSEITAYHIGFILGPRLNAAGRLKHAENALKLLLTQSKTEAQKIAKELNALNIERQEMCSRIMDEARAEIEGTSKKDKALLLLSNKDWPRGVVGIIASRLTEEYSRPTIVFEYDGNEHHGSARSVEGFDITAALSSCEPYLLRYGGHAKAAGLSVAEEHFVVLENELLKIAEKELKKETLKPIINIDTEIEPSEISEETMETVNKLEPFGYGNPQPVFMTQGVRFGSLKRVGTQKQHLKFVIQAPVPLAGVWFDADQSLLTKLESKNTEKLDLVFALRYNFWNNRKTVEARVIDARIPE